MSKNFGLPTEELSLWGAAFDPGVELDIFFDSIPLRTITTDSHGAFGLGPTFSSITPVLVKVPEDVEPGLHWMVATQRTGNKSFAVVFRIMATWRQYQFSADRSGLNPDENVLGPDSVSGLTLKWQQQVGSRFGSSPVVAGMLYVGSYDGSLYALDAETGTVRWKYSTENRIDFAPAVVDWVVYFGSRDGYFYALDARTGALLWKFASGISISPPVVADGLVYVGADPGNLYALQADSGDVVWSLPHFADSPAAVADGVVYVVGNNSYIYALNATSGAVVWKTYISQPSVTGLAVRNNILYILNNGQDRKYLEALAADTGAFIWTYDLMSPSLGRSPAVDDQSVYVDDGPLGTLALNAKTGALRWTFANKKSINLPPALADDVVYVGSGEGDLYSLDTRTGALLWSHSTQSGVTSAAAAVANGKLYVGAGDSMYAFGLPDQSTPATNTRHPVKRQH